MESVTAASSSRTASSAPSSGTSTTSASSAKRQKTSSGGAATGTLQQAFGKQQKQNIMHLLATAWASNNFPHAAIEHPDVRALFLALDFPVSPLPSRELLRRTIIDCSENVQRQVEEKIRGAIVIVAVDGWTNVKREKVTNIVLMVEGQAFYWGSIVNNDENTAAWLAPQLLSVIRLLTDVYQARVIGIVVDNEAVNAAAHKLLVVDLPFLLHIPCAAHTIQLIVRSCLDLPELQSTVSQLYALIRYFDAKEHRIALRRIQEARKVKTLRVLKMCDTRWHSLLLAAQRIMELQKEIITCYDRQTLPDVSADFFSQLQLLIDFLKPFMVATDRIQRDSATLMTVYQEFQNLREHGNKNASWALPCVEARWEKRVHVDAVHAVALLSFQENMKPEEQRTAQQFIIRFGSAYIWHYSLCGDESQNATEDALRCQLADFNARSGEFTDSELKREIKSIQSKSADGLWDPRKVWWLHPGLQLSIVAVALLSCSASEAAVERTFSAQGKIHTGSRNSLKNDAVQAEMKLTFNRRALSRAAPPIGCIELKEDEDDSQTEAATEVLEPPHVTEEERASLAIVDDEPDAVAVEPEEVKESVSASAAAAAAAAPAPLTGAQQRALRRAKSLTFDDENQFLQWFIQQHNLTKNSRIDCNITIALEGLSRKLLGTPGTATLVQKLREKLKQ